MVWDASSFYLEDMARRPLGWKVVEHVSHKKFLNGGVIVVEDDPDVIHVDNSSDLALSTIVDEEVGHILMIEEDPLPHELADSVMKTLNLDIDDCVNVVYSMKKKIDSFSCNLSKTLKFENEEYRLCPLCSHGGHGGDGGGRLIVPHHIRPVFDLLPTWNPNPAGPQSMRAIPHTCKRSIMGTVIPPPSQSTHSTDIARLKKREKQLTKQVNMFMRLFRSDDKFSQMLNQFESQPEYGGGGSGSGGCGDDEPGDDEDGGEDEER
ncbi:hypothetical protein Tco_0295711 [Tanacetum coccineum]